MMKVYMVQNQQILMFSSNNHRLDKEKSKKILFTTIIKSRLVVLFGVLIFLENL